MARADILISMVRSASRGDMVSFRKAVESLVAEERAKKHNILAERLALSLNNGVNKKTAVRPNGETGDLIFEINPQKRFDDLIINEQTLKICQELVEEQNRADLLRSYGLEPRSRILLAGPPGNGKTSLAEALAAHLMYPLLVIRYENLIGRYLGETASRLQKVFSYVKTRNCVLFFDEFDTIGKERGDTKETGEIKRVVSSLLLQMDRLPSYVVVITASNSAALASRGAALIYEVLDELRSGAETDLPDEYMAVVIKSLLVHGASWGNSFNILESCLKTRDNPRLSKRIAARYLGYGIPDTKRVIECTERRATAIGYGSIKKDEKHEFRFPLPPSLSGLNAMRRLTITLAWFSPINVGNRKYRKANLSFNPPGDNAGVKRINADWQHVKNGTIQHEVLEGSKVITYQDGENLELDVVCREDAGTLDESVNYGLAVTLEVAEDVEIPIYEEIRQRIEIPIKIDEGS